jgi:hypothetical protein
MLIKRLIYLIKNLNQCDSLDIVYIYLLYKQ